MNYPRVTLKKGEGRLLKSGGLWIFDNEIAESEEHENGELVSVCDFDGYPMGTGFINDISRIRVRMLTRDASRKIDRQFFRERIQAAWDYRKKTSDTGCCRLIFGEADFLPGLTVDKFEDVLVAEILALGIERLKETILTELVSVLEKDGVSIRGIYERNDAKVRLNEGLERTSGFFGEPFDTGVMIGENGVRYEVDVANGQKTGFFLDQKYNRRAVAKLCGGARVLDCFTHTGAFALNAAACGAKSVTAVDASEKALLQAKKNAELNPFGNVVEFVQKDVFEYLPELEKAGEKYDVVILDPPAFAKSRASVKNAVKGYKEINVRGLRLVKNGGFLATCSCSHFMTRELFEDMLKKASKDAHKRIRIVEERAQAPDHPILVGNDESYYLKFIIVQVLDQDGNAK